MDDRSPVWSFGESQLLHDPTDALDAKWWFGESIIFDEYVESSPETSWRKIRDFCGGIDIFGDNIGGVY